MRGSVQLVVRVIGFKTDTVIVFVIMKIVTLTVRIVMILTQKMKHLYQSNNSLYY